MTPGMLAELSAAAPKLAGLCGAIVLAGDGKAFCSGFDLDLCRKSPDGTVLRALLTGLSESILALRGLEVPVVAAVQGAAIAGGCALLGGCDCVVTHRDASFGYPVTRLGISPAVSAPFLSAAVGHGAARERLLDPGLISGTDAYRIGIAGECVESSDAVLSRALELAGMFAEKPPGSMAATKSWMNTLDQSASDARRALEVSLSLTGGPEERERLAASWAGSASRG
jgi:enoyl-CoA hydratase/carnithine racemase